MKSILFVDDDMDMCTLVKSYLEKGDYRVFIANDYKMTFSFLEKHYPDLILLDINLPQQSGLNILKIIRNHEVYKTIPVIMVSGDSSRESIKRAMSLEIADYIIKPFYVDTLLLKVERTLKICELLKAKPDNSSNKIQVSRSNLITTMSFIGEIDRRTIDQYKNLLTPQFLKASLGDDLIYDFHYQLNINENQLKIIDVLIKSINIDKVKVVSGRNYTDLLDLNIDFETQLFLSIEDAIKSINNLMA